MRRERERWDGVGREGQGRKKGAPGKEERRVGEGRWEREGGGVGGAGREGGREEEHGHLNPTAAAGRTELGGGWGGNRGPGGQRDSPAPGRLAASLSTPRGWRGRGTFRVAVAFLVSFAGASSLPFLRLGRAGSRAAPHRWEPPPARPTLGALPLRSVPSQLFLDSSSP